MSKFFTSLTVTEALMLIIYLSCQSQPTSCAPKEQQQSKDSRSQPLSSLDKIMKHNTIDEKTVSNMTFALNEMALNLGKMLSENKRMTSQLQEVMQRVQNVTGVNTNSTIKNLQQADMANISLASLNLLNLIPRTF